MTDEQPRRLEYRRARDLTPALVNPKDHATDLIADSVDSFGYLEPAILDGRTGRLIAGHGRRDDLLERETQGQGPPEGILVDQDGAFLMPVVVGWSSRDDDEAHAAGVGLNATTIAAGFKPQPLADLLSHLDKTRGLVGTGHTPKGLEQLLASLAPPTPPDNPTPALETATKVVQPGDLWALGDHRLVCGSAHSPEVWAQLLDGHPANLVVTSPPYADRRKYDEATEFEPIHPDAYVEWFAPVALNVAANLAGDGSWFVNIKAGHDGLDMETYVLDLVLAHRRRWGFHFATEFCWERNGAPGTPRRRFKNQFEPVYQFTLGEWKHRPDAVRLASANVPVYDPDNNIVHERHQGIPGAMGFKARRDNRSTSNMDGMQGTGADVGSYTREGLAYPGNRLPTFAGSHEATGHAAAFPVGLPAWFIRAYTDAGDRVLDPFCGSGSTILAAHETGRLGLGIELSPRYCDVILERFERHTGTRPRRLGTVAA